MKFFTYLFNLFNLLVKTTNHIIGGIRNLFNLHKVNQWIDFAGQDKMKNIAATFEGNPCRRRDFCNINTFINIYNVFAFWVYLRDCN
jgi:hypothetical protein